MELGNTLFGHSRGKYSLIRGKGFEEVLDRLFEVCVPNNRMYGEVFENEVFAIFPYYWGDCTCGDEQNHKQDCPIVKPNFLYKPTGFELRWYKYPLRDSYTNQKITLAEFKKIISTCIRSCHTSPSISLEPRAEAYIKDWNWSNSSHEFALQMGAFLLEFIDSLQDSNLSPATIRKHQTNCWLIGAFECDYGYHTTFRPAIFLGGPGFGYEFKRKVSNSKYAMAAYKSTWRRLEKYVQSRP